MESAIGEFRLLPAHVVQADLRPCSLNMNVNSYLFLFVRPESGCYCTRKKSGTHREKKHVLTLTLMLVRRKYACKTSAGSSKILICGPLPSTRRGLEMGFQGGIKGGLKGRLQGGASRGGFKGGLQGEA